MVHPVKHLESVSVVIGSLLQLYCEAKGFPPPMTSLSYLGDTITTTPNVTNNVSVVLKNIVVTEKTAGRYQCTAKSNRFYRTVGGYVAIITRKFIDVLTYSKLVMHDSITFFIHLYFSFFFIGIFNDSL